jgi:hypothetical protein
MLLGKLATPATKVIQEGFFNSTTISSEYLIAGTQIFIIGEDYTTFQIRFGNIITENGEERFDIVLRDVIKMTSEELSTWGTDDSVVLDLIANKIGTTITEKIVKDFSYTN